jgi:lipopolysaccharide cholinephosphotransferase
MNTEDKLSYEIQSAILDVFKEFRRICENNHLVYFAIGGTCIGAVRHKGFIPWDDDLDVAMPYPDYKKIIEVCKTQLRPSYSIFGPHTCKHYSATILNAES